MDPVIADPSLYNDDPITPSEDELLNYFEQTWSLSNALPSRTKCEEAGFAPSTYDSAIRKTKFHAALTKRGIVDRSSLQLTGHVYRGALTAKQLYVAQILLDFRDTRSDKKKLAECNVSTQEYQGWLSDPVFQNYMQTRSEKAFTDNQRDINEALLNRARGGDIGAIKYANQMTGYFDPDRKDVQDVMAIIRSVVDILSQELAHDPEKLIRISGRLLSALPDTQQPSLPVGKRSVLELS